MNCILKRTDYLAEGIFGELTDSNGNTLAVTLEHSYDSGDGPSCYIPKLSRGIYTCVRHAPNRLPYYTFEVQNVPNFQRKPVTGILIHIGNYNSDSDGCVLLGDERNGDMIMNSKATFQKFMDLQVGVEEFTLTVV